MQAVGVAATFLLVFGLSYATFFAIKKTIGLRVSETEERAGLDISSHGMFGYPEAFIPEEEYPGGPSPTPARTPQPAAVTAMAADRPSEA